LKGPLKGREELTSGQPACLLVLQVAVPPPCPKRLSRPLSESWMMSFHVRIYNMHAHVRVYMYLTIGASLTLSSWPWSWPWSLDEEEDWGGKEHTPKGTLCSPKLQLGGISSHNNDDNNNININININGNDDNKEEEDNFIMADKQYHGQGLLGDRRLPRPPTTEYLRDSQC
jgi:hypothetical protein